MTRERVHAQRSADQLRHADRPDTFCVCESRLHRDSVGVPVHLAIETELECLLDGHDAFFGTDLGRESP